MNFKNHRTTLFFGLSGLLHLWLLGNFFAQRPALEIQQGISQLGSNIVEIEKAPYDTKNAETQGEPAAQLGMQDFLPNWSAPSLSAKQGANSKSSGHSNRSITASSYRPWGKGGALSVGQSMGLAEYAASLPFFETLWERINRYTPYPEEIAKERVSGNVTVHLQVASDGHMVGSFLKVKSNNPLLEAYTLVCLTQALKQPLSDRHHLRNRKLLPLILHFHYRFGTEQAPAMEPNDMSFKNQLVFNKYFRLEPWLDEQFNKLVTRYFPPIIVVPGFFYVDFVRAYQMIKNFNQPSEESVRAERLALLRDKLEATISKHKLDP